MRIASLIFYSPLLASMIFIGGCLPLQKPLTSEETGQPSVAPDAPVTDPGEQKVVLTSVSQVFGGRNFVRSTLGNVFLSATSSASIKSTFDSIMDSQLNGAAADFGGSMNLYSTRGLREFPTSQMLMNGGMANEGMLEITPSSPMSPGRVSIMNEVCRSLMNVNDNYLQEALIKIRESFPPSNLPSEAGIRSLSDLFSPGTPIDSSLVDSYLAIDRALVVQNSAITLTERWRALVYLICSNPHWQSL